MERVSLNKIPNELLFEIVKGCFFECSSCDDVLKLQVVSYRIRECFIDFQNTCSLLALFLQKRQLSILDDLFCRLFSQSKNNVFVDEIVISFLEYIFCQKNNDIVYNEELKVCYILSPEKIRNALYLYRKKKSRFFVELFTNAIFHYVFGNTTETNKINFDMSYYRWLWNKIYAYSNLYPKIQSLTIRNHPEFKISDEDFYKYNSSSDILFNLNILEWCQACV